MDTKSRSSSNLSEDSLTIYNRKSLATESTDQIDTILVPFYEKDVLIKIPKTPYQSRNKKGKDNKKEKHKTETESSHSYLVNKERKSRKTSYLEIFRKQFIPVAKIETVESEHEIRSLTPECGDTERGSLEEPKSPEREFYNTESYNEMYYDKIMNQEISQYLENTFEQAVKFTEDIRSKSPDDMTNNFKSVSETSHQPRVRRATVEPIQNIRLGGLGPDIENIKPRLERARSLQRYSEKVRMENRLRIYRKAIENEKKVARDSARNHNVPKTEQKRESNSSYLVNKFRKEKSTLAQRQSYSKPISLDIQNKKKNDNIKDKNKGDENENPIKDYNPNLNRDEPKTVKKDIEPNKKEIYKIKIKPSPKVKDIKQNETPPVQINFLLNIDGVRPSTALRTLEEKHKMFQQKIKAFAMGNSDNS